MKAISERAFSIIGWSAISFATALFTLSSISLMSLHVDVVTQSPFFLYNNVIYVSSIMAVLVMTMLLTRVRNGFYCVVLLFILWSLLLITPYAVYTRSLPLYNDQLGFVAEALSGILFGRIKPIQGELTSLGHAYFTTAFVLVSGLDPIRGLIAVQFMLPILYVLPLLAVKGESLGDKVFVSLVVLASLLNPILYGRTPFAWSYLITFTIYLYNEALVSEAKKGLRVLAIVPLLIYVAYVVSDPTSLIIALTLLAMTLFNRKFVTRTSLTIVIWFFANSVLYMSGSLASVVRQMMALIEQPTNPVPSLIVPAVNLMMRLYSYVRELTVFLGFLVGFISSIVLLRCFLKGDGRDNSNLGWIVLYFTLVALQIAALLMNRWGMVPYSMYALTALPVLVIMAKSNKWLKTLALGVALTLIALSPTVKWGFSPIAFPTPRDLAEADFVTSHVCAETRICASGSHLLLWFYYWLHGVSAPVTYMDPLLLITTGQVAQGDCIAIFYRALNTYRLDVSKDQLISAISSLNNRYSVIYKSGTWAVWLK
jgi:hypothetical protein